MGKKRIPLLDSVQFEELTDLYMNGANHKIRQNAHIILLKSQGHSSKYITTLMGYPKYEVTVNSWLSRYEKYGIAGLKHKAGQGRKGILNVETDEAIVRQIVQSERQRLTHAKSLIEEKLGVQISRTTLVRFLKRLTDTTDA